ncbi:MULTISPECIES: hypothetical protein [unclassified Rhodococcus (in: high G+C Gram-positive bacteria)]|uniref:hypothetical protein n=1 Tax=unclassified Rhodococcus (in: high G+C Gram-positive bacteria) TaxID=192944 RepID=UPI00078916F6|nr:MULTISPECIES: hypothetical protein [unclassified Rhodococcus (in: high G+C Gram-positive bacteria)]
MTAPTSTTRTVEELLDAGAVGLRFFEVFVPLAVAGGATLPTSYPASCARYDEQRGLDADLLQSDADLVRAVAADARTQSGRHADAAVQLGNAWRGSGSDAALDLLGRQSTRSAADVDLLDAVASAMDTASAGLRSVVEDKSITTAHFWSPEVGGRDAALVAATVAGAGGHVDGATGTVGLLSSLFPTLQDELLGATSQGEVQSRIVEPVAAQCRAWLDTVFVPAVTERIAAFEQMCTATDTAVTEIYAALTAALGDVNTEPYPTSTGIIGPADCGCPTSTVDEQDPAGTGPAAAAPQPPAAPVEADPVLGAPAASGSPASDPLGDLVRGVVSALVSSDDSSVSSSAPPTLPTAMVPPGCPEDGPPSAPATAAGELGHLEAEWQGQGIRVALTDDGALDIRLLDPDAPVTEAPGSDAPATETLDTAPDTDTPEAPVDAPAETGEGPTPDTVAPEPPMSAEPSTEPPAVADAGADCAPPELEPSSAGPLPEPPAASGGEAALADELAQPEAAEAGPL